MGMSTYAYGLKEPSEKLLAMVQIRNGCKFLGIDEPPQVEAFFDQFFGSDETGETVEIPKEAITEYNAEMQDGLQVEIAKLPPEIKFIRFVNSY